MKKLSQMTAVELSDVLCTIAMPMERLMNDGDVVECFRALGQMVKTAQATPMEFLGRCMTRIVPVFLGDKHREDTFTIVAALKGATVEEVRKQPGLTVITDVVSMVTGDKDLMSIFRPAPARKGKKAAGGAVQARPASDGEGADQPD